MTKEEFQILLQFRSDLTQWQKTREEVDSMRGALGKLSALRAGVAGVFAAIGGSAVINGMERLTEHSIRMADAIDKARSTVGTTAREYQTFSGVLKDAGLGGEEFLGAIGRIQKLVGEAASGGREAQKAFSDIGVSFQSLRSQTASGQLETIARALARISNESDRAAATSAILGRSYQELRPLLDGLATQGFQKLSAGVERTRGMLSEGYAKAIDEAKDKTEAGSSRMAIALTPLRVAWERVKSGAYEYGAAAAEALSVPSATIESRIDKIKGYEKRLGELAQTPGEIARRAEMEIRDRLKVEQFMKEREEALAYNTTEKTGSRKPGAPSMAARRAFALYQAKKYAESQKALQAQTKLEEDVSTSRRKALIEQIDLGNALYLRTLKEEGLSREKARQVAIEQKQFELESKINASRARVGEIEDSRYLTRKQKDALITAELARQNEVIQEQIDLIAQRIAVENDASARLQLQQQRASLKGDQFTNQSQIGTLAPTSIFQDFTAGVRELQNGFATIGQTIANTIGTAMDAVTNQITTAILYTGDFAAALRNIGVVILEEVIRSIIRMGVQWVIQKTMIAALDTKLRLAALGQNTAMAAAQSLIWIGPATLATIASFGAAAAAAPGAIAAAKLASLPMAAFEYGGDTGDGPRTGGLDGKGGFLAMLHPQEEIYDRYHGTIGDRKIDRPARGSFADVPQITPSGGGASGASSVNVNNAFFDNRTSAETWLRSQTGENYLNDWARRKGLKLS